MEHKLLILGLDGAGKTTSLYQLKHCCRMPTIPTDGYNSENLDYNGLQFVTYDISGKERFRYLWQQNTQDTKAVLFVVDSSDRPRMSEVSQELHKVLRLLGSDCILMVVANKQVRK